MRLNTIDWRIVAVVLALFLLVLDFSVNLATRWIVRRLTADEGCAVSWPAFWRLVLSRKPGEQHPEQWRPWYRAGWERASMPFYRAVNGRASLRAVALASSLALAELLVLRCVLLRLLPGFALPGVLALGAWVMRSLVSRASPLGSSSGADRGLYSVQGGAAHIIVVSLLITAVFLFQSA